MIKNIYDMNEIEILDHFKFKYINGLTSMVNLLNLLPNDGGTFGIDGTAIELLNITLLEDRIKCLLIFFKVAKRFIELDHSFDGKLRYDGSHFIIGDKTFSSLDEVAAAYEMRAFI